MKPLRLVTISAIVFAVLACVLLVSSPAPVRGYNESITIEPAARTEDDLVRIGLEGWYENRPNPLACGDYWVPHSMSNSLSGQTITIEEVWILDPGPGGMCEPSGPWEFPYSIMFDVGPLPAGDYTVEVYSVPEGLAFATASFTVTPAPPDGDGDGDGVLNAGDNCPKWANPAQNLPSWPVPVNDPDCDGFSTTVETSAGTNPFVQCGVNAWPADINNDSVINFGDIGLLTSIFGQAVPPEPARRDIAPETPDGLINFGDIGRLTTLFGRGC